MRLEKDVKYVKAVHTEVHKSTIDILKMLSRISYFAKYLNLKVLITRRYTKGLRKRCRRRYQGGMKVK